MLQAVRRRPALAFLIATVVIAIATIFRWALTPLIGATALPYIFYFPAVAFVGLLGNLPAALFATVLAAVTADLFFISPPVLTGAGDLGSRVAFGAFVVTNGAIAAMTARLDALLTREAERARLATERGNALEAERSKLDRESRRLSLLAEVSSLSLVNPAFADVAKHIARRIAEVIGDACIIRVLDDGRLVVVATHHAAAEAMPFLEKVLLNPEEAATNEFYARLIDTRGRFSFASPRRDDLRERVPSELRHLFDRYAGKRSDLALFKVAPRCSARWPSFRAEDAPYSDTDLRAMEAVASRAALALDNARLFETARRDAEEARHAARRGRRSGPRQGRVPRHALARAAHAAQRHPRLGAHAAGSAAAAGAPAGRHRDHRPQRAEPGAADRRHPRRAADHGRARSG